MTAVPTRYVCGMTCVHHRREGHGRSLTRTQTPASDDEAFELLTRLADDADVSRSRLIEKMVGQDHEAHEQLTDAAALVEVSLGGFFERVVFLERDPYERLTNMAQHARADRSQFLEHLILRAEGIYNFEPPSPPSLRPWWKLWGKDVVAELPAIVADLRSSPNR